MLSIFLDLIDEQSDKDLFEELYNKYEKSMWYLAYLILEDYHRAEDATQDTFLNIAIHIKTLRGNEPNKIRNYLLTAVRNRAYDMLRKESKLKYASADCLDNIYDKRTSNEIENYETNDLAIKILKQMSPTYTDVMYMHLILGMSNKDIAKVLKRRYGTVTTQISRGHEMFYELYEKELNKQ